jgi:UDP-N-acetylmuramyl pentapeptide phosphotransferase/UDP-N-acetylglucosamine-1-phosphate transferase
MPFPKVRDYHKPGKPLVPSSYGILYALISVCYWYVLSFIGIKEPEALALATSVLFGSTMGLFDDMTNLRWRYKAILPIFTALPYMVLKPSDRTAINLLLVGVVDFGSLFFLLLVPLMVTVVTNTYNQLGGLNGLETLPGLIMLVGLSLISGEYVLTIIPIICLIYLGYLSGTGTAFIGNVGSFSIGLTLAVYAILVNNKLFLIISLAPHLMNSILILFSNYIIRDRANTLIDETGLLYANRVRSLRTLIIKYKRMTEHQVVLFITMISAVCVGMAYLITMIF